MGKKDFVENRILDFIKLEVDLDISDIDLLSKAREQLERDALKEKEWKILGLVDRRDLFGEDGLFFMLCKREKILLLSFVLDMLNGEAWNSTFKKMMTNTVIDLWEDNLEVRLIHLVNAARDGVFLLDWEERISQICEDLEEFEGYFDDVLGKREEVENFSSEIRRLLEKGVDD